jgi:tetratricopeptide (TPR) repeat protein
MSDPMNKIPESAEPDEPQAEGKGLIANDSGAIGEIDPSELEELEDGLELVDSDPQQGDVPKPDAAPAAVASTGRTELQRLVDAVHRGAKPHEILNVSIDAPVAEVEAACERLSTPVNPANFPAHISSNERERATALHAAVLEARDELLRVQKTLAEFDAEKAFSAGRWKDALVAFESSTEEQAIPPDSEVSMVWCRWELSERTQSDAWQAMADLDRLLPNASQARTQFYRGALFLKLDDAPSAKTAFVTALEADRNHMEARRQLQALRGRPQQGRETAQKDDSDVPVAVAMLPPEFRKGRWPKLLVGAAILMALMLLTNFVLGLDF